MESAETPLMGEGGRRSLRQSIVAIGTWICARRGKPHLHIFKLHTETENNWFSYVCILFHPSLNARKALRGCGEEREPLIVLACANGLCWTSFWATAVNEAFTGLLFTSPHLNRTSVRRHDAHHPGRATMLMSPSKEPAAGCCAPGPKAWAFEKRMAMLRRWPSLAKIPDPAGRQSPGDRPRAAFNTHCWQGKTQERQTCE